MPSSTIVNRYCSVDWVKVLNTLGPLCLWQYSLIVVVDFWVGWLGGACRLVKHVVGLWWVGGPISITGDQIRSSITTFIHPFPTFSNNALIDRTLLIFDSNFFNTSYTAPSYIYRSGSQERYDNYLFSNRPFIRHGFYCHKRIH